MNNWEPISLTELIALIQKTEAYLTDECLTLWQLIQINPEKWKEKEYAPVDGFWVLAICGKKVIWYNDIEEGFNISRYEVYGHIAEYHCEQDELNWCITKLFNNSKENEETLD